MLKATLLPLYFLLIQFNLNNNASYSKVEKTILLAPNSTCNYIEQNWMLKGNVVQKISTNELNSIDKKDNGCFIGFLSSYEDREHDSLLKSESIIEFNDTLISNCAIVKLPKKLEKDKRYALWLDLAIDSKAQVRFTSILAYVTKTPLGTANQIQVPKSTSSTTAEVSVSPTFLTNKWKSFGSTFTAKGGEEYLRIHHPGAGYKNKICLRRVLITEQP